MTDFSKPVVIGELSVAERIVLVQDIWDSIEAETEDGPISPELGEELDRRLVAHRASPQERSTWEEVKSKYIHRRNGGLGDPLRGRPS
ncbi:MAG TPA: addiction module protein [Pirellulales bacterium]|jgi:putative addiction module component (TIGR02574 family)|nr:addiction module protein [Pirellulales bacterium]